MANKSIPQRPQICRPKACKGCGNQFKPKTFRLRYCDSCRGECSVDGCASAVKAHGLCGMHLWRLNTHGSAGSAEKINKPQDGLCSVDGCGLPRKTRGYCSSHYSRVLTHGTPGSPQIKMGKPTGVPCEVAGCTRLSIGDGLCRMHYERRRNTGELGGPDAIRVRPGEGSMTPQGYRIITVNGRPKLEHRHVMEKILGRPLKDSENVHHRDGRRAFNCPSNLELWIEHQPSGQRPEDLLAWAYEIIETYGNEFKPSRKRPAPENKALARAAENKSR